MKKMNPQVDAYIAAGCGRCPLGGTPQCKVHTWTNELEALRTILLNSGLTEELKWKVPCYTYEKNNVAILGAFKAYCVVSFLKGALLKDLQGLLEKPGENTQGARVMKFTTTQQVKPQTVALKDFIQQAIDLEKAGLKVDYDKHQTLTYPEEFQEKLQNHPTLKAAFEALTPGRRRAYHLFFSAPKQAKTRTARVEKCIPQILQGKGLHD